VLLEIGLGLRRVPLVDHRFSLPQRSAPVGGRMKLPLWTAHQGKAQASAAQAFFRYHHAQPRHGGIRLRQEAHR
jgi:hypothetical protein